MNRLWPWLTILSIVALTAACGTLDDLSPGRGAAPNHLQVYAPSLQDWAQPQLKAVGPLPRYAIQAELDPSGDVLYGQMSVVVPNTDAVPWPDLVFRLYPNTPHYGGALDVVQVQVNGEPVTAESDAEGAALRLLLPISLAPGEEVSVGMSFRADLPRRAEGYMLFGWEDGILSLPGFYPTLAVRDAGRWAAEVPPLFADVLFNPVALYDVEFTAPANLTLVASGATLSVTPTQDGRQVWRIVGGPLREMTILASDRWESVSDTAAGATVTSYYPMGAQAAGQAAQFHAAAALRLYSDLYGPYPYTEFDVVAAPLGFRGMEYSGLVTIGEDLYSQDRDQLPFLVAHETAHQWWYAQVGSDPLTHPWLDEGPAEYAAFDYYRGVYGQAAAEDLMSSRWRTPYAVAAANGIDGPIDQTAGVMSEANYELLVYAKAALFFDALRGWLGDEMYGQVMRAYIESYRWRIATPQHFLGLAQSLSGVNLNSLAEQWLR
jgi:hypothetical protein